MLSRHQTALLVLGNQDSPGFALLQSILREGNLLIKLNMHIAHLFFKKMDLLYYIPAVRDIKTLCLK